jgi:hypothetical protein
VSLDYDGLLRDRIAHRMERLMLWHVVPPPPQVTDQCRSAVVDWLNFARNSGRLTRSAVLPCSPEDYESSPPAMVSDMWSDFALANAEVAAVLTKEQFGLLIADLLGEWPRRHGWSGGRAHFIGYQWIEEEADAIK